MKRKLYLRFLYLYALLLALCALILLVFYVPGMREGEEPLLTALQCFLLLSCISILLPIGFYVLCYRPLKKLVQLSYDCHSGNVSHPQEDLQVEEYTEIQRNLEAMAINIRDHDEEEHRLLSNLSHDFRSPLTSIIGYTTAILDGTIEYDKQDHYLRIILSMAMRLSHMSNDIINASRLNNGKVRMDLTVLDVNALIEHMADHVRYLYEEKGVTLSLSLEEVLPKVTADEHKIQQVIYNLLDNAVKFSMKGSDVEITTAARGRRVEISVIDHGIGISAERIPFIWDRFYTTSGSSEPDQTGSGLGLAIVKEIMDLHHQKITVRSAPGKGSVFTFTLESA